MLQYIKIFALLFIQNFLLKNILLVSLELDIINFFIK